MLPCTPRSLGNGGYKGGRYVAAQPMKSLTRSIVGLRYVISAIRSPYYMQCLRYRCIYSNIYQQNRLAARAIGRTGCYIGIPINCLSVFRLGRIFVLFSRLVRLRYPYTSRRGSATTSFARQAALACSPS